MRAYGYGLLAYIDDFILAPLPYGTVSDATCFPEERRRIKDLMSRLDIEWHPKNGCRKGNTNINYLDITIDTGSMTSNVTKKKRGRVNAMDR